MSASASRWIKYGNWLGAPVPNAALITFRLVFGAAMVFSVLRFWYLGWIEDHFLNAKVTFKYYGFEWVQVLPPVGMYALHGVMLLGALGILLGWQYRWSAILFFLSFTYVELIDLSYYLNHYYFVSLVAFWLIWAPANRRFSIDAWRRPALRTGHAPRWSVAIFQWQIALVYVYAGLAKINSEWLLEAMPLRIWMPANDTLLLIGPLMKIWWMPWVFSWAGMLYDCTIIGFLMWARTRPWAYACVLAFHGITGMMFQIGVFPLVMSGAVLIFFSNAWHERLLSRLGERKAAVAPVVTTVKWPMAIAITLYLAFQVLFPWRYLLYPGNLFWTEEGYRFSWRVMLMEKAGTATFYVKDKATGREGVVNNGDFLCSHQEKQMAMQPDMILQFAHFLAQYYREKGVQDPAVRAEVYVTLNARPGRLLLDPYLDLTQLRDGWRHKNWLLPDTPFTSPSHQ